jgi:hypothetical protein
MPRFITVHDADSRKKYFPKGRPVRVRADAVTTLRGYAEGRTRTVLGIQGSYLHVTETEDEVLRLIGGYL